MIEDIGVVTSFWAEIRHRLSIEAPAPLSLNAIQLHSLLREVGPNQVHAYRFDLGQENLMDVVKHAMTQSEFHASLVEVFDEVASSFDESTISDWSTLVATVIGNAEASLESKVSAAEVMLLYGPDAQRISVLDQLAEALDGEEAEELPERTSVALGLLGALTGKYLIDRESDDLVEFLNIDNLVPTIGLLNRWKLWGRLWRQVHSSDADEGRDALLRKLHELHPDTSYSGVTPQDFFSLDITALENRVGRSVLLHLAAQPTKEAWTQYISSIDLGNARLRSLDLLLEARPADHESIVAAIDANLAQVDQNTFDRNLTNNEEGYATLFGLESHEIELTFPDEFFEAAVNVVTKGGLFKASNIPDHQRERILSGVWSKIVAGDTNVPTYLLKEYVGLHVQHRYDDGGREEFTQQVLPRMIRSENAENLGWAVDFLFARHRVKATIPEVSDAEIQAAITEVYPRSSGDIKTNIERLARKKWFSLPARPNEALG